MRLVQVSKTHAATASTNNPEDPMSRLLPVGVAALFDGSVEHQLVEFKPLWDDCRLNNGSGDQIIRSVCAFSNDIQNLGDAYIVVGVEERSGVAQLDPPRGIVPADYDKWEKEITGKCRGMIDPPVYPNHVMREFNGAHLLIIHVWSSPSRPHSVIKSKEKHCYIRRNGCTMETNAQEHEELLRLCQTVAFDDDEYKVTSA